MTYFEKMTQNQVAHLLTNTNHLYYTAVVHLGHPDWDRDKHQIRNSVLFQDVD